MHLDRQLKRLDIRIRDQQIAYLPLKVMSLAAGCALVVVVTLIFVV